VCAAPPFALPVRTYQRGVGEDMYNHLVLTWLVLFYLASHRVICPRTARRAHVAVISCTRYAGFLRASSPPCRAQRRPCAC